MDELNNEEYTREKFKYALVTWAVNGIVGLGLWYLIIKSLIWLFDILKI